MQPVRRSSAGAWLAVLAALAAAGPACAGQAGPGVEERPALSGQAATTPATADLSVTVFEQFQQFQSQLEALTGRIEELEHQLKQAREQERARYLDVDSRLKALQPGASASSGSQAAATAAATPPAAGGADEQALLDAALGLVREKKYDQAIGAFEQQLRQFPRGELVPVAMFWLGEMWLVATPPDAPKAGRYFRRVYNEYPRSSRASAAMYRHGLVQCQGGEVPAGRVTLSRLLAQYPGTPDAKLAESALRQQCQ